MFDPFLRAGARPLTNVLLLGALVAAGHLLACGSSSDDDAAAPAPTSVAGGGASSSGGSSGSSAGGGSSGSAGMAGAAASGGSASGGQAGASGAGQGGNAGASGSGEGGNAGAGGSGGGPSGPPITPVSGFLAGGASHTCAVLKTGKLRCWGSGQFGALGYGNNESIGDDEAPSKAGDVDVGGQVIQVAAGSYHTCALLSTGAVRCWGMGESGQLGHGNTATIGDSSAPASAGDVDVGGKVIQIAAGGDNTCALLEAGNVRCWGVNDHGELGYGNVDTIGDDEAPSKAGDVDVGGKVTSLAVGPIHTCALLEGGSVRCWGFGGSSSKGGGVLGYGNIDSIGDNEPPSKAGDVDVGGKVIQVVAGLGHTCALLEAGNVRCWGDGWGGELGYGKKLYVGDDEAPSSAGDVDVGGKVVQLTAGNHHTCALLEHGTVRCWGHGGSGQLGNGVPISIGDDEVPASAGDLAMGGTVIEIAAGLDHTCALLDTGHARCWGEGDFGQLGYGNTERLGDSPGETPAKAGDVNVGGLIGPP